MNSWRWRLRSTRTRLVIHHTDIRRLTFPVVSHGNEEIKSGERKDDIENAHGETKAMGQNEVVIEELSNVRHRTMKMRLRAYVLLKHLAVPYFARYRTLAPQVV